MSSIAEDVPNLNPNHRRRTKRLGRQGKPGMQPPTVQEQGEAGADDSASVFSQHPAYEIKEFPLHLLETRKEKWERTIAQSMRAIEDGLQRTPESVREYDRAWREFNESMRCEDEKDQQIANLQAQLEQAQKEQEYNQALMQWLDMQPTRQSAKEPIQPVKQHTEPQMPFPDMMNMKQAMAYLHLSRRKIEYEVQRGHLRNKHFGRAVRFEKTELDRYKKAH